MEALTPPARGGLATPAEAAAMVCWLFVGSWTLASIFPYLGGHDVIEHWVLAMNLQPWQFLVTAQIIIFLPMLETFGVTPYFFAMLVALTLQTSFLTPPVAMSAYHAKGALKSQIDLIEFFKGLMPCLGIVIICMILMYQFPGVALWLRDNLFEVWMPR